MTGTLVAKHDDINACMGFTSYEKLYSQFEKQVDMGIEKVVLNVDSASIVTGKQIGRAHV